MNLSQLTPRSLFAAMCNTEALRGNYKDMDMLDFLETIGNFNRDNTLAFRVLIEPTGDDVYALDVRGADAERPLTRKEAVAIIRVFDPHFPDHLVKGELLEYIKAHYTYAPATPQNTIVKNEK